MKVEQQTRKGTFRKCPCGEEIVIPNGLNCYSHDDCGCIFIYHPKEKEYLCVGYPLDKLLNLETKITKQQRDDIR